MTAEYFKIFEKGIGLRIRAIPTKTWTESLEAAKQRKCDIFSLVMPTPERKKYMNFTRAYLKIPLVLATKLDVTFFTDISRIKGKKIGITKGYTYNEIIRRKYPNIEVVDVETMHEGLQKVVNGELFGFIGTMASIGYSFQKEFVGELKVAGKFDENWELGIGVRNDEPLLLEIFNKAIEHLSLEERQKILNKYLAIKYESKVDYTLLIQVLVIASLLILFSVYHNTKLIRINNKMKLLQEKLHEQAHRDPMTNLYNRRYFYEIAQTIMRLASREETQTAIIMIDVDKFKLVNDTYGHAVGDIVLKKLSSILQEHTRKSDTVSRFGGEEFTILLPSTSSTGAMKMAENLRVEIANSSVTTEKGATIYFTVSLGVTLIRKEEKKIDSALQRADEALYEAKASGRNKVSDKF